MLASITGPIKVFNKMQFKYFMTSATNNLLTLQVFGSTLLVKTATISEFIGLWYINMNTNDG